MQPQLKAQVQETCGEQLGALRKLVGELENGAASAMSEDDRHKVQFFDKMMRGGRGWSLGLRVW